MTTDGRRGACCGGRRHFQVGVFDALDGALMCASS